MIQVKIIYALETLQNTDPFERTQKEIVWKMPQD